MQFPPGLQLGAFFEVKVALEAGCVESPASYLTLILTPRATPHTALYGHPFSEYCSYEKKYFFLNIF